MKKVKSFGLFALVGLLVVGFCACSGSSNDSVTLKVESQLNSLSEYLTVDDKEVVVSLANETKDGKEYKAILSSLALTVKQSVASNYGFDFEVVVLDKNHIEITELPNYKIDGLYDYDNEDLNYYLSSGFVRAQMKHGIEEWTVDDQKLWEKIREEGAYIQIKPNWSSAKFAPYKGGKSSTVNSEGSDEDTYSSSNSTTEDWDALLDSYEEYVESYISLLST